MPIHEVDIARLPTPEGYAVEVYKMLSIMMYPHDKLARNTFVLSATSDMLEERAAQLTPRGTVVIHNKPRDVEIRSPKKLIAEALMPRLNFKGEKGKVDPNDPYSGPNIAGQILKRAFALARHIRRDGAGWVASVA